MGAAPEESTLLCADRVMASCYYSRAAHKGTPEDPRKKVRTKGVRKLGSILGLVCTYPCIYTNAYIHLCTSV